MVALAFAALVGFSPARVAAQVAVDLDKYIYPMAKAIACPKVTVDASDDPSEQAWADKARLLVIDWFPHMCRLLATEDWRPPREIRLVVKKTISAPAYTAGSEMTINGSWIEKHPDDFGMVIHELTHVIQSYPDGKDRPGWLVEGIADYIRWFRYEPDAPRPHVDPVKSSYKNGYRVTAAFLAWLEHKYDMRLVPALDRAMRHGEDPMPVFTSVTGKDADALWAEFTAH